ncbi:discoidin domain-containing protein [Streptomyces sp. NPDC057927]
MHKVVVFIASERREFTFNNSKKYLTYRVNISENGTNQSYVRIGKLELFEIPQINKILILDSNDEAYSIENIDVYYETKMSSNNLPTPYVISASSYYSATNLPYKAFDGDISSRWATQSRSVTGWIQIDFGERKSVNRVKIAFATNANLKNAPKNFFIQGSNDNIVFDNLKSITNQTDWDLNRTKVFSFSNLTKYRYYRIEILSNNGDVNYSIIDEIVFGYKSNNVKFLSSVSEENFITHGMNRDVEVDLLSGNNTKIFIEQSSTILGEGKVFKKSIDTSKIPIKNIEIK